VTILTIAVAFLAGIVSFASPCCLPMVPAYGSYIVGTTPADSPTTRRTWPPTTLRPPREPT